MTGTIAKGMQLTFVQAPTTDNGQNKSQDNALVVWTNNTGNNHQTLYSACYNADAPVIWHERQDDNPNYKIHSRIFSDITGTWLATETRSENNTDQNALNPKLTSGSGELAFTVWEQNTNNDNNELYYAQQLTLPNRLSK